MGIETVEAAGTQGAGGVSCCRAEYSSSGIAGIGSDQ